MRRSTLASSTIASYAATPAAAASAMRFLLRGTLVPMLAARDRGLLFLLAKMIPGTRTLPFSLFPLTVTILMIASPVARAAPIGIKFSFSATVIDVPFGQSIAPATAGAAVNGSFSYDLISSGTPQGGELNNVGYPQVGPFNLDLSVGALSLTSDPGLVLVRNDWFGVDEFDYVAEAWGTQASDWSSDFIGVLFQLSDDTEAVFSGTPLPTQLDLADFPSYPFSRLLIEGTVCTPTPHEPCAITDPAWIIQAEITDLVPEPSTALLLAFGLVGLAVERRHRGR